MSLPDSIFMPFSCQVEEGFLAHAQMKELGMQPDTNLFEMAGCLLRLVMWPTGEEREG
jgi:hypothetical protein